MELVCKTKFEKAWLVASIAIFVAYRLCEGSAQGFYTDADPVMLWLELAMIALSFPLGGLTVFALHGALFWCDDCRNMEFLFGWPTLLVAGYIQWFWVLPEFLRNRKLTLLDLGRSPGTLAPAASPDGAEPAITLVKATASAQAATSVKAAPAVKTATSVEAAASVKPVTSVEAAPAVKAATSIKAVPPAALEAAPLPAFDVNAFVPRYAEFDEAGLTALDRVFQAQALPPPAPALPSHAEAIFPRVS